MTKTRNRGEEVGVSKIEELWQSLEKVDQRDYDVSEPLICGLEMQILQQKPTKNEDMAIQLAVVWDYCGNYEPDDDDEFHDRREVVDGMRTALEHIIRALGTPPGFEDIYGPGHSVGTGAPLPQATSIT